MISENNQPLEIVNPKNLLIKIISSPKEAFIFINNYKYDNYVTLFLILSGTVKAFDKAISKNMGDSLPLWGVIICSILIGITFGWIINFLYAYSISFTGRWFNAKGETRSILRILSYALLPSIFSLFLIFLQILIYGNTIFQSSFDYLYISLFDHIIYYTFFIIDLFLVIWSFVLLVIGVSIVQQISIGKTILNLIIPAILVILSAIILFIIVDLLSK